MATLKSKGCKLLHSINDKAFDTALLDRGTTRRVQFVLAAYVFEENSVNFCLFCTLSHTYCVIPSRSMSYYFKQRFMLIKNNYTHLLQISKCISNDKSYLWPLKLQLLGSAHTQMYLYFQSFWPAFSQYKKRRVV